MSIFARTSTLIGCGCFGVPALLGITLTTAETLIGTMSCPKASVATPRSATAARTATPTRNMNRDARAVRRALQTATCLYARRTPAHDEQATGYPLGNCTVQTV